MSVWICGECTAPYSVDAPRCPQCGENQPIKEGEQLMPKITVHGGPSNADAEPGQPGYVEPTPDAEPAAVADESEQVAAETDTKAPADAETEEPADPKADEAEPDPEPEPRSWK